MGILHRLVFLLASVLLVPLATGATTPVPAEPLAVGSKRFTESYVLGEILRLTLEQGGVPALHRQGLGNTAIVEQALRSGRIDLYPEYTGTIVREILKRQQEPQNLAQLNEWLRPLGLKAAVPLGFNNSYALAMTAERAQALGLRRISDLARLSPEQQGALRTAFTQEFTARRDGWPAIQQAYSLQIRPGRGLDHSLAYQALAQGQADLMDAYATDAAVSRLKLVLLEDDRHVFPRYDAVLLMRQEVNEGPLKALQGRIDASTMAALNQEAEQGQRFEAVAARALEQVLSTGSGPPDRTQGDGLAARTDAPARFADRLFAPDLLRLLGEHLLLVAASTGLAIAVGAPLGLMAQRWPRSASWVLGCASVLQTVPSLALLALLIAAMGRIGVVPALAALFLYALLPVISSTHAGLLQVGPGMRQAGLALGMRPWQVLCHIERPLAWPVMRAGVGSAAVTGVGTATVAAFVGAGGLGERIVAGLAVNDSALMLAGAVPAAALALVVQALFWKASPNR
ncbi:MAG: glycine betaine ABC transporter substrate-binding protein [Burkholderiaceae bacterium]